MRELRLPSGVGDNVGVGNLAGIDVEPQPATSLLLPIA